MQKKQTSQLKKIQLDWVNEGVIIMLNYAHIGHAIQHVKQN